MAARSERRSFWTWGYVSGRTERCGAQTGCEDALGAVGGLGGAAAGSGDRGHRTPSAASWRSCRRGGLGVDIGDGAHHPHPRRPRIGIAERLARAVRQSSGCGRPSAHRRRTRRDFGLVRPSRPCGDSLRRWHLGGVGRHGASGRRDCGNHRSRQPEHVARNRRGLPSGKGAGRHARPRLGGGAKAARPHVAPLSAELPVVHGGRLGGDPFRRPLRDQSHAHRRLR